MIPSSSSAGGARPAAGPRGARPSSTPEWLVETVVVLEARRTVLLASAIGLSLLGIIAALLLPQFVPPRPLVGAAVGLAAALLAVAIALGVDSVDLTVRGARHVRAAGGRLAASFAGEPDAATTAPLADVVEDQLRERGRVRLGVAPASRSLTSAGAWTDALAVELGRRDHRVVVIDLTPHGDPNRPGVTEIVADGLRLGETVRFDVELPIARLGPGRDGTEAVAAFPALAGRIPGDVEVLVVALPSITHPGCLESVAALDDLIVLAAVDRTPRVDLIAALEGADAAGTPPQVVLLEPSTSLDGPAVAPSATTTAPDTPPEAFFPEVPPEIDLRDRAAEEPEAGPTGISEPVPDEGPWSAPPAATAPDWVAEPVAIRTDDADDPVRAAAAIHTLAQEVWSRENERA